MTKIERATVDLLFVGGLAAVAYILFRRYAGALAQDAAASVVINTGDALGIPRTNEQKCADAVRAGDRWNQSLYCPADEFVSRIFPGNNYDPNGP